MTKFLSIILIFISFFSFAEECSKVLTFDDAVTRMFFASPRLNQSSDEISQKLGIRMQSTALPNPIVSYSVENVLGNKHWRGWRAAETRYELSQMIELNGKRGLRYESAQYQVRSAEAGYEAQKRILVNILRNAFIDVAAAQEHLQMAEMQLQLAKEVLETVQAKIEGGKASIIQQHKAEIAFTTTKIHFDKAVIDYETAKQNLSLLWGESCPDFDCVEFDFYTLSEVACIEDFLDELNCNPELLQLQYDYLSALQVVKLEQAERVPDLEVTVGYKTERDHNEHGMIFGAAIPIPILNTNKGNIQRARADAQKLQDQYDDLMITLEMKVTQLYKELQKASQEIALYQKTLLKSATDSFLFAQEGFKEGKFEYLDMLDAQRTLFELRDLYIKALEIYHKSFSNLSYLNSQVEL